MPTSTSKPAEPVLLARSGGVDSAVCALLLRQAGYAVRAVFIQFSPAHGASAALAQKAADELGLALDILHCEDDFRQKVIAPFCLEYVAGRTPSPCLWCNPLVKFAALARQADALGIRWIASGHYARVCREGEQFHIAMAASAARDQSYMLYRLPQNILSRLLLPLGTLEKAAIRDMARQHGLSNAGAPDSQEICFIPNSNYPAYILSQGYADKPGRFIGPSGEDLGAHLGVSHYTIGQRRGLGLSAGRPLYVGAILDNGDVQLAESSALLRQAILLENFITTGGLPPDTKLDYLVKIRSAAKAVPCRLSFTAPPGTPVLRFGNPQRAPAPGQHAVLYHGERVVGGGVIRASVGL